MTEGMRGSGGPGGPSWTVDLLADLHAGVLDQRESARLWERVNTDPEAQAVLAALDSVGADLAGLRDAPAPPMPDRFAAALDQAIAAEATRAFGGSTAQPPPAPVIDLAAARRRRKRLAGWGAGVLTAAAAAVAVTFAAVPDTTDGRPAAQPPTATQNPGDGPLAVSRDNVGAVTGQVTSKKDYGPLKDQAGLDRCVKANEPDADKLQSIGVRQVTFDGKQAVMTLLIGGEPGKLRVLVVTADCTELYSGTIGH